MVKSRWGRASFGALSGVAGAVAALGTALVASALPSAAQAQDQGAERARVIVAYKAGGAAAGRVALAAARADVKLELPALNATAVELPAAAVAGLARSSHFEYVEEDAKRYPMTLTYPSTGAQLLPYGVKMVQADQLAMGPSARKVCIIDSGYSWGHPDLPTANVSGYTGNLPWNVDGDGHGTHVAGTIAAVNNSIGVVGVAPGVQLYIVRVFGDGGTWAYSSTLADAASRCQAAGSNVISMSLGGSVSSRTEQRAFDSILAAGILPIAAAGNGGNNRTSYPAGYGSVVSVAAVDENRVQASFSQYNKDVEIAAPGVGVLSTVPPGQGLLASLSVGSAGYEVFPLEGSVKAGVSGPLADFGLGSSAAAGTMTGKVCLIARGTVDFATKVNNCSASGGIGAVVYNNAAGNFAGTLGGVATSIPSVSASQVDGQAMLGQLGASASLSVRQDDYAYYDGTSMATPHVSAVAALVWSHFPQCNATQIRNTLNKTAIDLGTAGRDTRYGFGLVQAKAAHDRIAALTCNN